MSESRKDHQHENTDSSLGGERKQDPLTPEIPENSERKLAVLGDILPQNLSLIAVNQALVFPGMVVPMVLSQDRHKNTISYILDQKDKNREAPFLGVIVMKNPSKPVQSGSDLLKFGVVGRILKRINLPDGSLSILVNCLKRFEVQKILQTEPELLARVTYLDDILKADTETEALARTVVNQFKQISQDNPMITEEMRLAMLNVDGPGKLSDLLASILVRDNTVYGEFLETLDVKKRLEKLLSLLKKEVDVHNFQIKIQGQINQNVSKMQRDFFLNEQLKLIQKELGHTVDEKTDAKKKFSDRAAKLKMPEDVAKKFKEEMEKLEAMNDTSPEFGVTYNYLDWLTSLPWGLHAKENLDINYAKRILQKDHYGLKDVKERILEFIAVRKLKSDFHGGIICLVGPPGVGKTSLGKSVARALKRPFFRFSVGGMRDEAEIKGHRRTYVGAMPGKIIQGLKKTNVDNPVFMIDEIDKLGNDFRGDPSSALLEVLDPEQNVDFLDHYMDVPFNASNIFFICTANQLDTIPQPLLDRMEVIRLSGYTLEEKLSIAKRYIIPKQLERNGVSEKSLNISEAALRKTIDGYAREAGVRGLEKWIEQICRKRALEIAQGGKGCKVIKPKDLEDLIGPAYFQEDTQPRLKPGMAVGMAWTPMGGDTLIVESVAVTGVDHNLKLTGQMGSVMTESANLAWTYVKNILSKNKEARKFISENGLHLHIPAGAVPKDGPSAGITLATSLYGLVTSQTMKKNLAMTGELTLSGNVLPVGGIKEKVIAAKRNGYCEVILPQANARDLKEIPAANKKGMKFRTVKTMSQVLSLAFPTSQHVSGAQPKAPMVSRRPKHAGSRRGIKS